MKSNIVNVLGKLIDVAFIYSIELIGENSERDIHIKIEFINQRTERIYILPVDIAFKNKLIQTKSYSSFFNLSDTEKKFCYVCVMDKLKELIGFLLLHKGACISDIPKFEL